MSAPKLPFDPPRPDEVFVASRRRLPTESDPDTGAPVTDGEGNALCTRCSDIVPYASMSLNEDGYFCAACAARLTQITASAASHD